MSQAEMIILIVFSILFLIILVGALILIYLQQRRMKMIGQAIAWQFEKMRRFANGWRPTLWDPDDSTVTVDQKIAAILAYAEGEKIPPSGAEALREQAVAQNERDTDKNHRFS